MKKILIMLVLFSCKPIYRLHTETYNGKPVLVGKATLSDLMKEPYNEWFTVNYKAYQPEQEIINKLKSFINAYDFRVILGTWCGDSQLQVPAFYKVLKETAYQSQPEIYCVLHEYKSYQPVIDNEITRLPTIIVLKKNREIGRIIEYPMKSIENDLYEIIYTGNYRHELMQ